jgi:hypothetical protein
MGDTNAEGHDVNAFFDAWIPDCRVEADTAATVKIRVDLAIMEDLLLTSI